jgi:hypothetical protein
MVAFFVHLRDSHSEQIKSRSCPVGRIEHSAFWLFPLFDEWCERLMTVMDSSLFSRPYNVIADPVRRDFVTAMGVERQKYVQHDFAKALFGRSRQVIFSDPQEALTLIGAGD